ncbi:hypothetical protein ACFQ3P_26105 [Paraburkholderia sabiae]|uniref:Uncharacterized protein n=1 Tax=Paraburkholderia sabiae TaxID=273251 RepID=A0ABU9QL95_9BURK|nr:hypothetical protein [Paraburkholderia sabiae]WJZ77381.1 hypothetical protein QEN71_35530 [Paraburkholderia sabiae]CAD6547517.1 hypothetical protein LMG24235_04435 [Paraburkholderia sabiae]
MSTGFNEGNLWYAGHCVRHNDIVAHVAVTSIKGDLGWSPVENATKLFPKSGEVEVRQRGKPALRVGDWVAFRITSPAPKGRNQWQASKHRPLHHFTQAPSNTLDDLRRLLTVEGLSSTGSPGAWMVQISQTEAVRVDLTRWNGGRLFASPNQKVTVYAFDPDAVMPVSDPLGSGLYDLPADTTPKQTVDWSTEEAFLNRWARALSRQGDKRTDVVIDWLRDHADATRGALTFDVADTAAVFDMMRSGELADRLSGDRELLRSFTKIFQSLPRFANLLDAQIASMAEQERKTIRARTEAELASDVEQQRQERMNALEQTLKAWEADKRAFLEAEMRRNEEALTVEIANSRAAREQALHDEFRGRQAQLKEEVQNLQSARDRLHAEARDLDASMADLRTRIEVLKTRENEAKANVDRLLLAAGALERPSSGDRSPNQPSLRAPDAREGRASDLRKSLATCPLLTDHGKTLMLQVVALCLAGEVPVLTGQGRDAFLMVAEALLSGGESARIFADPTLITYEDLWSRPGTAAPTPMAQAFDLTRTGDCSMLTVIENAERSGARFWYPALKDGIRRGGFPRRLFVCATVADTDAEEAHVIRSSGVVIDVSLAITKGASAIATQGISKSARMQFAPDEPPSDLSQGAYVTGSFVAKLDVIRALGAARTAAEAIIVCGDSKHAGVEGLADLFSTTEQ